MSMKDKPLNLPYGRCTGSCHHFDCADTCRMWPVARSSVCISLCLSVRLKALCSSSLSVRHCDIVHNRARLCLCVRLPSDYKEKHRACACCVWVCLLCLVFGSKVWIRVLTVGNSFSVKCAQSSPPINNLRNTSFLGNIVIICVQYKIKHTQCHLLYTCQSH